jgi:DNA-binding response OmpR family regulator
MGSTCSGRNPVVFRLAEYDVLLLDSELGMGDALEWLARLIERADCPPIVFMIDAGDDISR